MDLTVGITNYNAAGMTLACIESVKKYTKGISYEIIVVDNKSVDDSVKRLLEVDGITLIQASYNSGFTRASNVQLREAHGEYFILLNNDTELLNDALSIMVEFMREHPEAGAIGPQLFFSNGEKQYSYGPFKTPWHRAREQIFPELRMIKKLIFNHSASAVKPRSKNNDPGVNLEECHEIIGRPRGCAFMVKTDIVKNEIGLLDEQFFIFTEETDWALRFHKAGYKNYFVGTAKIMHHWSDTVSKNAALCDMIHTSSHYKYYRKHFGITAWLLLRSTFLIGSFLNFTLALLSPFSRKQFKSSEEFQKCIDKLKKGFMRTEPLPQDTKLYLKSQGRSFNV